MDNKKKQELQKVPTRLLLASIKSDIWRQVQAAKRKQKPKRKRKRKRKRK